MKKSRKQLKKELDKLVDELILMFGESHYDDLTEFCEDNDEAMELDNKIYKLSKEITNEKI